MGLRRRAVSGGRVQPVWLLDLDNTLHDAATRIMPRIDQAMTAFMMQALALEAGQADALRQQYAARYGATLPGLVHHHDVDPQHFLRATHNAAVLARDVARNGHLAHVLKRLPGFKVVFTNAPSAYAHRVVRALGIAPWLDGLIAIEHMYSMGRWHSKPSRPMLRKVLARLRQPAWRCVLVEDSVRNLRAARQCGLRTVWVSAWAWRSQAPWQRPRRGQWGIDVHLKRVVELTRTTIVKGVYERR